MQILTEAEVLAITGNQWKIHCYRDGNRRNMKQVMFIRAETRQRAEDAAKRWTGCPVASAFAYRPWEDSAMHAHVRRVDSDPPAKPPVKGASLFG